MSQNTRDRLRQLTSSSPHTDGDVGQYDRTAQLEALDPETIYHLTIIGSIHHNIAVMLWNRLRDRGEITDRLCSNLAYFSDPVWRNGGRRMDMKGDDKNG